MRRTARIAVVGVMVASLLLAGCGGGGPAAQPTVAPTAAPTATAAPTQAAAPAATQTPGVSPKEAQDRLEKALDNVVKLAPVHIVSSFSSKKGDTVESQNKVEVDIDAKGNQHLILSEKDGEKVELYIVDKKLYLGAGEGDEATFMQIGDAGDSLVAALSIYGGATLGFLNNLEGAKKVASESVNGFQADKYEFVANAATMGLVGLAAQAQGGSFSFQSYAWVEPASKALVRSRVDWSWKDPQDQTPSEFHQEFDASKGTVQEIKLPKGAVQ